MMNQDFTVKVQKTGLYDGSRGGWIDGTERMVIGHIDGDTARMESVDRSRWHNDRPGRPSGGLPGSGHGCKLMPATLKPVA